jgi:limonene-1,2-epoxide hydrolase
MTASADDVIRRFTSLWPNPDTDELMSLFADDAVYHNIPVDPIVGKEAIRSRVNAFWGKYEGIDFIVHRQVADEGVVMNERTDVLRARSGTEVRLPVAGVFEVRDGLITAWRDYYDYPTSRGQSNV